MRRAAAVVGFVVLFATVPIAARADGPLAFLYPADWMDSLHERVADLENASAITPEYRWTGSPHSFGFARLNLSPGSVEPLSYPAWYRVAWESLATDGHRENQSVDQRILDGNGTRSYVAPADLKTAVEVPTISGLATILRPNLASSESLVSQADELAESLGLQRAITRPWEEVEHNDTSLPTPFLYGSYEGRYVEIVLDCAGCRVLVQRQPQMGVFLNFMAAYFDENQDLVLAQVSPWISLADSGVLTLPDARDDLEAQLRQRGLNVSVLVLEEILLNATSPMIHPTLEYVWAVELDDGNHSRWSARATQDARDGKMLGYLDDVSPNPENGRPPSSSREESRDAPTSMIVPFMALVVAVLVRPRSRASASRWLRRGPARVARARRAALGGARRARARASRRSFRRRATLGARHAAWRRRRGR